MWFWRRSHRRRSSAQTTNEMDRGQHAVSQDRSRGVGGGPQQWPPAHQAGSGADPAVLSTENAVDAIGFLETFARTSRLLRQVPEAERRMVSCRALTTHRSFPSTSGLKAARCYYAHAAVADAFGIAMTNTGIARTPTEAVTGGQLWLSGGAQVVSPGHCTQDRGWAACALICVTVKAFVVQRQRF